MNKNFIQEKVYSNKYAESSSSSNYDEAETEEYLLTLKPDQSVSLSRKYIFKSTYSSSYSMLSKYTGFYEIVTDIEEMRVIMLHLKKESKLFIDSWDELKYTKNSDVNIDCEVIEYKSSKRLAFSNTLKNFQDKRSDDTFYENQFRSLISYVPTSEIKKGMIESNGDIKLFLSNKFFEYNLQEGYEFLKALNYVFSFWPDKDDIYYSSLLKFKGDKYQALELLSNEFKLFKDICESKGVSDPQVMINNFKFIKSHSIYGVEKIAEFYFESHDKYKDQNNLLKEKYGLMNEEENFIYLFKSNGNILEAAFLLDSESFYKKTSQELKEQGFTNENTNLKVLKEQSSFNLDEYFFCALKIEYDEKMRKDFYMLKFFGFKPHKKEFELYNQNNRDWTKTIMTYKRCEYYLELYKDVISPDVIVFAVLDDYGNPDIFKGTFNQKLEFFKSKGEKFTQSELLTLLAYSGTYYKENDYHYNYFVDRKSYFEKTELIQNKFPQLMNPFEITRSLLKYQGNINDTLYNLNVNISQAYEDEITYYRQITGLENMSEKTIAETLIHNRSVLGYDKERLTEMIRFFPGYDNFFFLKNRINLKSVKDFKELSEVLVKHNKNEHYLKLYFEFPHVYQAFEEKRIEVEFLYLLSKKLNGNLEQIHQVYDEFI